MPRTNEPCHLLCMSTTITARELAELLKVPTTTLYRWVQTGLITAERTPTNRLRFNPETVRDDYKRANAALPATFAAYLLKPTAKKAAAKSRAEARGAA